jgi:hypothetical protein
MLILREQFEQEALWAITINLHDDEAERHLQQQVAEPHKLPSQVRARVDLFFKNSTFWSYCSIH